MIYESKDGNIDLSRITRLYPAANIELDGDIAEMSLEWMEMNEGKVNFKEYVLVFDFTQPNEKVKDRKVLNFQTQDELMIAMQDVARFFENE